MTVDKFSLFSVTPVWALVAVAALLILLLVPSGDRMLWLPIALAAGTMVTFCVQLGLDRKEGLVLRVIVSLGGSVVILAIATGIAALLGN